MTSQRSWKALPLDGRAPHPVVVSASDSEDSQQSIDPFQEVARTIDPSDSDIYIDALFGPMYRRFERILKGHFTGAKVVDYAVVGPFMLLNVLLQLTIAVKVLALSNNTYSENVGALFEGGCTNMDQTPALYGIVWPKALQNATVDTYDCSLHLVTMSFYPELLDLNGDQLWSMTEALQKAQDIKDASGIMPHGGLHGFQRALKRMIADDVANAAREGYPLRSSPEKGYLDLAWFQRNREKLKVCEVADKHMCGNLEADHVLDQAFPDLDPDQRVAKCSETEQLWCRRGIFGESQHALYKHKKKTCGAETYIESHEGLPILSYESVETYRGDEDSVTGSLFFTLFLIVLFVWGMIMVEEFRAIHNFWVVIWYFPSTNMGNADFASLQESKMLVRELPVIHKGVTLMIVLLRLMIAVILFYAGLVFLSVTTSLTDLILNSTALSFLIEVDTLIHMAFLGESFRLTVTDRCDMLTMTSTEYAGRWRYAVHLPLLLIVLAIWIWHVYYGENGLFAISDAMLCLCQAEGRCLAATIIAS
ncbi:unnamed protein product [Durusdinium trenchii]|uniref:Uncharacterized protein n=2 Tax=Durusdinium trenchii TaxID=1381693 RepID=A0ABP0IJR7_9DINO